MTSLPNRRPCWAVLAPVQRAVVEREIRRAHGPDDDLEPWQIVAGAADYLAVLEFEPGSECAGDEDLAKVLSRHTTQPVYVLWLHDEAPRVQAFGDGAYKGEIAVWPDDVAAQLGCSFPLQDVPCQAPVDLTPHQPPAPEPGERRIAGWTVAEWSHLMKFNVDWSVMLDGASDESVREAIDALADVEVTVRLLAVELVGALGVHGLGAQAVQALAALERQVRSDPDERVRTAAGVASVELREAIECEEVRREFPWILNYHPAAVDVALATLDDARLAVRRELYLWWASARGGEFPAALQPQVVAKLTSLAAQETDPLTLELVQHALEQVRAR